MVDENGKRNGKSAYFRHAFTTTEEHTNLELRCQFDDGLIIYLDGKEVARRIERGEKNVLKALSRSRFAIQRILALGDQLRKKERRLESLIKVTEEELENDRAKLRLQTLNRVNRINRLNNDLIKSNQHLRRLERHAKSQHATLACGLLHDLAARHH